jgi:hypothetical protein
MKDLELLKELLAAENEEAVLEALNSRSLMVDDSRWRYLGGMPNNQSIVHAQQSNPAAALIEKLTNSNDALLLRYCKELGIDPRGSDAPLSMPAAVDQFLGDVAQQLADFPSSAGTKAARSYAEEHLVLYATGSKERPSLSLYDAGEASSKPISRVRFAL